MIDRIVPQQFMLQPREIRVHLAGVFSIPRSGISEIRDQEVLSDGHTMDDLAAVTLEKMCAYIGSEETFGRAWELSCAKARHELHPPIGVIYHAPEPELKHLVDDTVTHVYIEEDHIIRGTFPTLEASKPHAKKHKAKAEQE